MSTSASGAIAVLAAVLATNSPIHAPDRPVTSSARSIDSHGVPVDGVSARIVASSFRIRARSVRQREPKPHGRKRRLTATVYFCFNESRLRREARSILETVADRLARTETGLMRVDGYADSVGDPPYNTPLSGKRIAAVQEMLSRRLRSRMPKVDARPHGEKHPAADNEHDDGSDNPAGRALNRRVILTVEHATSRRTTLRGALPSGCPRRCGR